MVRYIYRSAQKISAYVTEFTRFFLHFLRNVNELFEITRNNVVNVGNICSTLSLTRHQEKLGQVEPKINHTSLSSFIRYDLMHNVLKIAIMIFICHKFRESRPAVSPKVTILSFLENIFIVIFCIKLDVGFNQKLCISFGICKKFSFTQTYLLPKQPLHFTTAVKHFK